MTPTRAVRARMRSSVEVATEDCVATVTTPRVDPVRGSAADALEIGVDHHLDELLEVDRRRPPELPPRLRAVADEMLHFGRTDERRIELDVLVPVEPGGAERDFDQVADRVADAGRNDVSRPADPAAA